MTYLNLGILAHVDAGKTTLTERLLFDAGVIPTFGSVDAGTTQTDSLTLERQRGITIRAAVAAFVVGDVTVNLIDTPGHPDFIAEVNRSLAVLDGVLLVVSAVEGVQAQTVVLARALDRLRVPTLLFVNKVDRPGADPARVLEQIRRRLGWTAVPLVEVTAAGSRSAQVRRLGPESDPALADALANDDDRLLELVLDDRLPHRADLFDRLAVATVAARVHPAYAGSALTGVGVDALTEGLTRLLPVAGGDPTGPASAQVFKIDRGPDGHRRAHLRIFDGTVRVRDRLPTPSGPATVARLQTYAPGGLTSTSAVTAGGLAVIPGVRGLRVGDRIGPETAAAAVSLFAPPTLRSQVSAADPHRQHDVHAALTELAEQDSLIDLQVDDGALMVSLFGEVQKEVLQATLAADFGLAAVFSPSRVTFREWPASRGTARRAIGDPDNPWMATLGLAVEPAEPGGGTDVVVDLDSGRIPLYIFKSHHGFRQAITGHVLRGLRSGPLGAWVQDCRVTVTDCDYISPSSTAADFAHLTVPVLSDALRQAGTVRCAPVHRFRVDAPTSDRAAVLALLARRGAIIEPPVEQGDWCRVEGEIDVEQAQRLGRDLPAHTHGEGVLELQFSRFAPTTNASGPRRSS